MPDSLFTAFTSERCPDWLCPECHNASLAILPGSFSDGPCADTVKLKNEIWFDTEHYKFIFSCRLICERSGCQETVAVSGTGWVDQVYGYDEQGNQEQNFIKMYEAKTFYPPLPLFIPPEGCSENLLNRLSDISALLTGHAAAAANAIRSLPEVLLDDLEAPRIEMRKGKKDIVLKLHHRIENYQHKFGNLGDGLMALKHMGNSGSHGNDSIRRQHLEDACHVIEQIVTQLCKREADLTEKIARLHKAYAPTLTSKN